MSAAIHAAAVDLEQRLPDWKLAYRVHEAAASLGLSEPTIWRRIATGKIKAKKDCGITFISRAAMLEYIDAAADVPLKQAS